MNKEYSIKGTFYLKNGVVIEKEIAFKTDNPKKVIEDLRCTIKDGFKYNRDFHLLFGYTVFRGSDLSAVTLVENF